MDNQSLAGLLMSNYENITTVSVTEALIFFSTFILFIVYSCFIGKKTIASFSMVLQCGTKPLK